jgi:hypothetical protein
MTKEERENAKRWVEAWQRVGPELELERRKRIRESDTVRDMEAFRGMASWELKRYPPLATSGLVEQQRLLGKHRR